MDPPRIAAPVHEVDVATTAAADSCLDLTAEIRRRAWQRYVERGGREGYDLDDWLESERELLESPRLARLAARDDVPPRSERNLDDS